MRRIKSKQEYYGHTVGRKSNRDRRSLSDPTLTLVDATARFGKTLATSLLLGNVIAAAHAAEIAPFRTTNVEGKVELRYLFEERTDSNNGVETLKLEQTSYEEEISVLTQNYVYHPRFLKLDLGAGVTFVQDSYESTFEENQDDDELYSLLVRGMLLEKKPHPLSFYYIRENPVSFPGFADRIQQTNTLYGFNQGLLEPLIPLNINIYASHSEYDGDSPTLVVDETTDKYGIRASKIYTDNYSQRITFDRTEEESASGRLVLAITPTMQITEVFTYNSEWRIREEPGVRYHDRLSVTDQQGPVDRDEVTFSPNLLWTHSDKLRSFYSYNFLDSTQNEIETTNQAVNTSLHYNQNERTEYELRLVAEDSERTGVDEQRSRISGQVNYRRPLASGTLGLVAGLGYQETDRETSASQATVIGEQITLSGLTPVALANEFIELSTIVVQNLARSQTFIEGIDYRVTVIGSRTEIQRLSGSNIGDPEDVLVDYNYDTGGSAGIAITDQSYAATYAVNGYDFYLRYRRREEELTSGNPTLPLNDRNTLSAGAAIEYPLSQRTEVGAGIDLVEHDEDISPYNSQRYSAFANFVLPRSSNLRITASRSLTDNEKSVEDVDLTALGVVLRSRPGNRLTLSAELYTEEDTGGTVLRKRDSLRLLARWQIYRLFLHANANFINEETGPSETEREEFMLTLRREF